MTHEHEQQHKVQFNLFLWFLCQVKNGGVKHVYNWEYFGCATS